MSWLTRWLTSRPSRHDDPPDIVGVSIQLQGEDDLDDLPGDGEGEGERAASDIADVFCAMEYVSARGECTRRRITMKRFDDAGAAPRLYAWCHERRAIRSFRLERIACFISVDGEVLAPDAFWASIGISPPITAEASARPVASRPAASAIAAPAPRADLALRRSTRRQLRVLAGLGRCDGVYRPVEIEQMLQYALKEGEWDGIAPSEQETEAFRAYLGRLRPTREALSEALHDLFEAPRGKHRLYAREAERFLAAACAVAQADGEIAPEEFQFLEDLRERAQAGVSQ